MNGVYLAPDGRMETWDWCANSFWFVQVEMDFHLWMPRAHRTFGPEFWGREWLSEL